MHNFSNHEHLSPHERLSFFWQRGVRVVGRLAVAFGVSAAAAIAVGAAVTDNAFVQILVTAFATFAFWIPAFLLVVGVERLFKRRPSSPRLAGAPSESIDPSWGRLAVLAPGHSERVGVLQRSLTRSRLALGRAELDPDAHDLCVLIDRRLPELIDRELDVLPPDDRDRARRIDELVDLIEQFARHCSRRGSGETGLPRYDAEVLRRRFEDRLSSSL